jgi:ABC-2 type transport system ATP-binding protein
VIEVVSLTKRYGERLALDDVTFDVPAGSITAFVGPNGAGKTTLMKIACGLLDATSGLALVDDEPFAKAADPLRTMGICLGPESLPGRMGGMRFLDYVARTQGGTARTPRDLFQAVGLVDERLPIGRYSTGMRQRLCVALAMLGEPANLILDEPMNGLDLVGVRWLRETLRAEAQRGAAILLSSHILSELTVVADRVVMISAGTVVRQGRLQDVVARQGRRGVYVEGPDNEALSRLIAAAGWHYERRGPGFLVQHDDPMVLARRCVETGVAFRHLSEASASLEDAFFETATMGVE